MVRTLKTTRKIVGSDFVGMNLYDIESLFSSYRILGHVGSDTIYSFYIWLNKHIKLTVVIDENNCCVTVLDYAI